MGSAFPSPLPFQVIISPPCVTEIFCFRVRESAINATSIEIKRMPTKRNSEIPRVHNFYFRNISESVAVLFTTIMGIVLGPNEWQSTNDVDSVRKGLVTSQNGPVSNCALRQAVLGVNHAAFDDFLRNKNTEKRKNRAQEEVPILIFNFDGIHLDCFGFPPTFMGRKGRELCIRCGNSRLRFALRTYLVV